MLHEQREMDFRIYVTDALRGLGGFTETPRYYDLITGNTSVVQETRSADEIKDNIKERLSRLRGD